MVSLRPTRVWNTVCAIAVVAPVLVSPVHAADLQPRTVAAFERYVAVTQSRLEKEPFLRLDVLPEASRRRARDEMQKDGLAIERLTLGTEGRPLELLRSVYLPDYFRLSINLTRQHP